MSKNFSDEQLDRILENIVKDSLLNEDEIGEIADSPKLRWSVQSRIRQEKASRAKIRFPFLTWRIAAFASLIFIVFAGLISFVNFKQNDSVAEIKPVLPIAETLESDAVKIGEEKKTDDLPDFEAEKDLVKGFHKKHKKTVSTKFAPKRNVSAKKRKNEIRQEKSAENLAKTGQIKTEFIALSYSPAPESGQILKVKVPRSMMVSLGVAFKIENSSQLVNAEVVMGDDGLARAIRFVQ